MADIIEVLRNCPNCMFGHGSLESDIEKAEKELSIKFAEDYRLYLKTMGLVAFDGEELTGITTDSRLSVVDVTKYQRSINPKMEQFYVIEELNFDGIVIWQNTEGKIYQTVPNSIPVKIYESMEEYVSSI